MQHTQSPGWAQLKQHIYHEDGALRDLFVRNATLDDWKRWAAHVSRQYRTEFIVDEVVSDAIDMDTVIRVWQGGELKDISAVIDLDGIIVRTYFFSEAEIENDISPTEIRSAEDHERLLAYMKDVSQLLGKPMSLHLENPVQPWETFIVVDGATVRYPGIAGA